MNHDLSHASATPHFVQGRREKIPFLRVAVQLVQPAGRSYRLCSSSKTSLHRLYSSACKQNTKSYEKPLPFHTLAHRQASVP